MQIPQSSMGTLKNKVNIQNQNRESHSKDVQTVEPFPKIAQEQGLTDAKLKKIKVALESFNEMIKPTHIEFKMHNDSGRYFVKIVNDKTQEVIKQIPSEDFLNMLADANEQLGLLVDKRV